MFEVKCREGYLITARNMNFLLQSGRVELAYEATQFKVQISNLSMYLYRIYSTELIRKDFVSSHINSYVLPKTILLYCKSTVFGWSYELICEGKKSLLTIHTLNRIEIRNDNVSHHQRHSHSSLRSNLYLYHIPYLFDWSHSLSGNSNHTRPFLFGV